MVIFGFMLILVINIAMVVHPDYFVFLKVLTNLDLLGDRIAFNKQLLDIQISVGVLGHSVSNQPVFRKVPR